MPEKNPRHSFIKNLASKALGGPQESSEPVNDESKSLDLTPSEAIDLYFVAESSEERDAAFSCIARQASPESTAFLAAMMAHDEDVYLRLAAAVVLARSGIAEAQEYVVQTLIHANDDLLFEQALEALVVSKSPTLLEPIAALWQDPERDEAERRMAMMAMERVDADRALILWLEDIEQTKDVRRLNLERLAIALGSLWRKRQEEAETFLRQLRSRVRAADFADEQDARAMLDIIDDATALVQVAEAG